MQLTSIDRAIFLAFLGLGHARPSVLESQESYSAKDTAQAVIADSTPALDAGSFSITLSENSESRSVLTVFDSGDHISDVQYDSTLQQASCTIDLSEEEAADVPCSSSSWAINWQSSSSLQNASCASVGHYVKFQNGVHIVRRASSIPVFLSGRPDLNEVKEYPVTDENMPVGKYNVAQAFDYIDAIYP